MATPAAMLAVLVEVDGVQKAARQIQSLDGDMQKAGVTARRAGDDLEDVGKRGSRSMGGLKGAIAGLGAIGGVTALVGGMKGAVEAFDESRKVGAQTEAAIKATGGAAGVTAKQVGDLAGAISSKTGIDDEAIQKGSNLLLTFKNVRNEAGKGRDIFDQTTKAAVDLSAAGFGSIESTSKQLGKALNDPVKGLTALGRSGVTFSEDQKKAITALAETGKAADRTKAQQMILAEVNGQVGGSAVAQATAMDKLKVQMGNVQEVAGGVLVGALEKGIAAFQAIVGVVSRVVGWFRQHETVALALAAAAGTLGVIFLATLVPAMIAGTVALGAQAAAWVAVNVAMLANPFVLVAVALAALVAGLVVAYRESETFRKIVDAAFGAVKAAGAAVFAWLGSAIPATWGAIRSATSSTWNAITAFLSGAFNGIKGAASTAWAAITSATDRAWDAVKAYIVSPVTGAASAVRNALGSEGLAGWLASVWTTVKSGASSAWATFKTNVVDPVTEAVRTVKSALGEGKDGLITWLGDKVSAIKTAAENIAAPFKTAFDGAKTAIESVATTITRTLNTIIRAVNRVIKGVNKLPGPNLGTIPELAAGISNFKGGLALVGEHGPELVSLARGASVFSNAETARMLEPRSAATSSAGVPVSESGVVINVGEQHFHDEIDFERGMRTLAWMVQTA